MRDEFVHSPHLAARPMTNFAFLPSQFSTIAESATKAESYIVSDPRTACFHARFTLEAIVHWLYRFDRRLRQPYDNTLSALLHERTFQNLIPQPLFHKAKLIKKNRQHRRPQPPNRPHHRRPPSRQRTPSPLLLAYPHLHPRRPSRRRSLEKRTHPSTARSADRCSSHRARSPSSQTRQTTRRNSQTTTRKRPARRQNSTATATDCRHPSRQRTTARTTSRYPRL